MEFFGLAFYIFWGIFLRMKIEIRWPRAWIGILITQAQQLNCCSHIRDLLNKFEPMSYSLKFSTWQACLPDYESSNCVVYDHLAAADILFLNSIKSQSQFADCHQKLYSYLEATKENIKSGKLFAGLKFAMLIHTLLLTHISLDPHKFRIKDSLKKFLLLHYLIKNVHKCLDENARNTEEKDKIFLNEHIILPYSHYLMKKFQVTEIKLLELEELEQELNPEKSDQNQQLSDEKQKEKLAGHYEKCYKKLNLLNKGLVVSQKIITTLRYYQEEYEYLENFNLLLAIDFASLYSQLAENFQKIRSIEKWLEIQSIQYEELVKEIEKTHESMYVIFLNRYNAHNTRHLTPTFLEFEREKKHSSEGTRYRKAATVEIERKGPQPSLKKASTLTDNCTSMRSLQTESDSTIIENGEETGRKKKEELDTLLQLQESFKKKFNLNKESELKVEKRRKNKSFFEAKKPAKLVF